MLIRDKPLKEIILRRYEKPSLDLNERELVKKFCLSLGLLQPGDRRDVIVDILYVLMFSKEPLSISEIKEKAKSFRELNGLTANGLADSNIRRQLRRLKEIYLVEKIGNAYYISENLSFEEILNTKIKNFLVDHIFQRIQEYAKAMDILKNKNV
ncbi:MAG: hypothetical protein QXS41_00795 [Candidatus Woesearchaeota archaeon]